MTGELPLAAVASRGGLAHVATVMIEVEAVKVA
jgi:hypothetical protein